MQGINIFSNLYYNIIQVLCLVDSKILPANIKKREKKREKVSIIRKEQISLKNPDSEPKS